MAKNFSNHAVKGLSGTMGDFVYRQMPNGSTYVSIKPVRPGRGSGSANQKAHRLRFREAAAYARKAAHTKPIYAELAAADRMKSAYNFALADWFHGPVIHGVERRDGRIRVQASDNVLVARVQVTILDEAGKLLERGPAHPEPCAEGETQWWEYAPGMAGRVLAEAWDLPGNRACAELDEGGEEGIDKRE